MRYHAIVVLNFRLDDAGRVEATPESPSLAAASAELPQGSYTTLRTYGGRGMLRLRQHVARLNQTIALLGGPAVELTEAATRALLRHALDAAAFRESRVRLTWAPPALFASVEPFLPLPEALYRDGARCVTLPVRRQNPHAKDTHFIATAQAAYGHLPAGVHEGLIVADDGTLLEGLSSNFFAVLDGCLRTEGERALFGVTRSLVIEVAARLLPIASTAIARGDLPRASEAFITSVSRGIVPVVEIDGQRIGTGRPGEATRRLRRAFADLESRDVEAV